MFIYIYIYIEVRWPILVEGHPKAIFSLVITLRSRVEHYSFSRISSLTLDFYLIMLSVKQGDIKYHFCVFFHWLNE